MSRLIREPVTKLPNSVNPPPPKKAPKRPVFPLRLPAGGRERGRGVGGARRCGAAGSYLREMSAPTDSPGSSLLHARARAPLKSICAFIYRTLALMDFCQAAPNHQGLLEGGDRGRAPNPFGVRGVGVQRHSSAFPSWGLHLGASSPCTRWSEAPGILPTFPLAPGVAPGFGSVSWGLGTRPSQTQPLV